MLYIIIYYLEISAATYGEKNNGRTEYCLFVIYQRQTVLCTVLSVKSPAATITCIANNVRIHNGDWPCIATNELLLVNVIAMLLVH